MSLDANLTDTNPPGKGQDDDSSLSEFEPIADDNDSVDGGNGTSEQEKKEAEELAQLKRKQNEEMENKLNHIISNPNLWESPDNKFLREFVNRIECNREKFPCMPGDSCYKDAVDRGQENKELTKGYISALAAHDGDTLSIDYPVLYVLSRKTKHEAQTFEGFSAEERPPRVTVTNLRLVDGDGNQMLGRLATDIAHPGRELKKGDIIRLDRYTELTHRINDNTARMPFVLVLKYSPVWFCNKPPVRTVHEPMPCTTAPPNGPRPAKRSKKSDVDVSDAPVEDCLSKRYCSKHGVSFVNICVCDSIPVPEPADTQRLASIQEDCYFATDELEKMSNSHKRNMIYWWYATNVYSICGKGKRKQLPKCLVHKIRQLYPSAEYSGFELHCGMHNDK